jgi:hypothetical protein
MYIEIILYEPKKKVLKVNSSATNDNKEDFYVIFMRLIKLLYIYEVIFFYNSTVIFFLKAYFIIFRNKLSMLCFLAYF